MTGRHALLATITYVVAGVFFTWPLARLAANHVFPRGSPDDILLVIWILAWDVHAFATDPARLFDANILHPAPHILAHSEHLLGALPLFAPAYVASGNPVLALNVMMLASFVLGGLFMHALMWTWTRSTLAAYAAGLSFAFAPWRINGLNWPHLLSTQYLPLVLLGLDRTLATRRPTAVLLLAFALGLQLLASYYLAYMAAILVAAFVVVHLVGQSRSRPSAAWIALATGLAVPAVALLLVSLPYLDVGRAGIFRWDPPDRAVETLAAFGSPASVLGGFAGWGPVLLALVGLVAALGRGASAATRMHGWTLALVLVVALAVSPGPGGLFGGAIAAYSWLAAVVPGFSLVRVPFRFGILASFAVSGLAGLGAWRIARSLRVAPNPTKYAVAALILGCALHPGWQTRVPAPQELPTRDALPSAYGWLAAHGQGAPLLELPISERPSQSGWAWGRAGARAMYFSTYHWLPILNGYTGYRPHSAAAVDEIAGRLPRRDAVDALAACTGLRWILVRRLPLAEESAWAGAQHLRLVASFPDAGGADRLYEVVTVTDAPCDDARLAPRDGDAR
jgi:hypothetical protein